MLPPSMRVRFAPSPTGALHIGGARTALYNWLLARGAGGASSCCGSRTPTASARPPRTSSRSSRRSAGSASTGTASPSSSPGAPTATPRSSSSCWPAGTPTAPRAGPDEVRAFKEANGSRGFRGEDEGAGAVRLRVPDEGATTVVDVVRGETAFENALQDDLVIARADGTPVYHLAVVVDDHDAGITHVVRGADHYSNTPKHVLIQQAMGVGTPVYAHLPLLHGAGRQEALQAPRRGLRAGAARPRLPARGGPQLPRAARLGLRRGDDVLHDRGAAAPLLARAGLQVARGLRRAEAALDERPLRARAEPRRPDGAARGADRAHRAARRRRRDAGEDLDARRVLAAGARVLRGPGRRSGGPREVPRPRSGRAGAHRGPRGARGDPGPVDPRSGRAGPPRRGRALRA